jgi:hypothetical protein
MSRLTIIALVLGAALLVAGISGASPYRGGYYLNNGDRTLLAIGAGLCMFGGLTLKRSFL